MNIKIEQWNEHQVRFIEVNGEWWAIGKDICDALGYVKSRNAIERHCRYALKQGVPHPQNPDKTIIQTIVNEVDIYSLVFNSQLPEAKDFQYWVYQTLSEFRKSVGLEGYQLGLFSIDREKAKEYQKKAMDYYHINIPDATAQDYIKINTITDKVTSNIFGFKKMLKMDEMTPEMIPVRQRILRFVSKLYVGVTTSRYLGVPVPHISQAIYNKLKTIEDVEQISEIRLAGDSNAGI